jgi:hypothetical protein
MGVNSDEPGRAMDTGRVPDWRIYFAAQVSGVSGANPVGAQPGDIVVPITDTRTPEEGRVHFPVVSPYRLALGIAIRASADAKRTRKEVRFAVREKGAQSRGIELPTPPALFDYFEQCMIAATFSYQALETYANQVVEENLRGGSTLTVQRRQGPEAFDAATLQREVSTEEKVATVLPMLLNIAFDKSGKLWQQFTIMRRVRDSIIHLKAKDHYVRGSLDKETVFFRLLNNDPRSYPRTALGVMRLFAGGMRLSWLTHAEERLEAKN